MVPPRSPDRPLGGQGPLALLLALWLFSTLGCGRIGVFLTPLDAGPGAMDELDAAPLEGGTALCDASECTDACAGGSCADACAGDGCSDACAGGSCADACAGGSCADACAGDGCADAGAGGTCAAACVGEACPGACLGRSCACPDGSPPTRAGVCGCGAGVGDATDSDADGVLDCVDFCPGIADKAADVECGCAAAEADADRDGVRNCDDGCPLDPGKLQLGVCGCGVSDLDADGDGVADCSDACPSDEDKTRPGVCGCGTSDADTDLDGTPDCIDVCSGANDAAYVSNADCGVGFCRANNLPSSCVAGIETACQPAQPLSASDATCDGVDDDCSGSFDEDFTAISSSCGLGACVRTGTVSCVAGSAVDSCEPGTPLAPNDATCDDVDDDCDGQTDENVVPVMSSCAMGACATMGTIACVNGALVDSCMATAPMSPVDTTCNNVDDNCNGQTDEGFVPVASSCGVGSCARGGTLTCVSGSTVHRCV